MGKGSARERRLIKGRGEDRNQGPRREIPASRTKGTMCAQGAKESFGTVRSGVAPGAQEGSVPGRLSRRRLWREARRGKSGRRKRRGSISPSSSAGSHTKRPAARPSVRLAVLPPAPIQVNSIGTEARRRPGDPIIRGQRRPWPKPKALRRQPEAPVPSRATSASSL